MEEQFFINYSLDPKRVTHVPTAPPPQQEFTPYPGRAMRTPGRGSWNPQGHWTSNQFHRGGADFPTGRAEFPVAVRADFSRDFSARGDFHARGGRRGNFQQQGFVRNNFPIKQDIAPPTTIPQPPPGVTPDPRSLRTPFFSSMFY